MMSQGTGKRSTELNSRRIFLCASSAQAGLAASVLRDARQQRGLEPGLAAPAQGLLHAGCALHFHGALVRLRAQRAQIGVNGQGYLHGGGFRRNQRKPILHHQCGGSAGWP